MHRLNTEKPRIISFAPSITETVFALGGEEHLVGVTDFCTWPPAAKSLPKVGGYINPNYEQILSLKPDIVILLKEHGSLFAFLEQFKIKIVKIDNENLSGIIHSISQIGAACGRKQKGKSLGALLDSSIKATILPQSVKPRVLFCVGRDKPGSGTIGKVFCAGPRTFYSELIVRAGGENAVIDSTFAYPSLAGEGIIHMAPDIIIDVMASIKSIDSAKVTADWNELTMIPAVKLGTVYALTGNYVSIPGPRIIQIFNDLHRCITDWQARITRENACLHSK